MLAGTILAFGSARKLCSSNNLTEYSIQLQHITKCAPCQIPGWRGRYLEIRLPVSGLERYPACHPERSEGSLRPSSQTLRCAQGDRPYLPMSKGERCACNFSSKHGDRKGQYISKKRPSGFVILSAAKDLSLDRDPLINKSVLCILKGAKHATRRPLCQVSCH